MYKLILGILFFTVSHYVFSQDTGETKRKIIRDNYKQILEMPLDVVNEDSTDRWPMYIDGIDGLKRFLKENIRYPEKAINEKIEGTVVISYVITNLGTITDISVSESPHVLLSNEFIRVMKMSGPWLPGIHKGTYKSMRMSKSYEFSLEEL